MAWQEVKIGVWHVLFDADATREFYRTLPTSECNCANCRNFRANWRNMPLEDKRVFTQFGIEPIYHGEIMLPWRQSNSKLLGYIGFHHFVGKVLSAPITDSTGFHWPTQVGVFSVSFEEDTFALPRSFPQPCVQLMYDVALPWLLDDELLTV